MPKNNVEELVFLKKMAGASDDLNMQISAKEAIIDEKNKKIDSLKKEFIALEDKIKNVDNIFQKEMQERVIKLEDREADLKKREEQHEDIVRESEKYFKEQEQKNIEETGNIYAHRQLASNMRDEADNQFRAVQEERELVQKIKFRNEVILAKIEEEQIINSRLIKELEAKRMNTELIIDNLREKRNDVKEKIKESDDKLIVLRRQAMEIKNSETEVELRLKELREIERKNEALLSEIALNKAELEIRNKSFDDKIKQIQIESDNNTKNFVALRAKEITLNEKEQSLAERERNIKILEAKFKGV